MKSLSRRDFVKLSSAAAAAVTLGACTQKKAEAKIIPVGVQLYSVRTECEKDFPKTIETIATMGYDGVEFAGYYDYSAKDLKGILNANGLKCCGSHTQLNTLVGEELEKTIEFNSVIGNKYLICPWLPEEKRQTIDDWKKLADLFNEISEKIKSAGMQVGYHNHGFEFEALEGQLPWDVFAQNTVDDVILQIDLGNAMHGGGDAMTALQAYPGRATTVHCKAYSASNEAALIGEDEIPWDQVFAFCETQGGTEWYIIEEEKDAYPPLVGVEKSLINFKAL